MSHRYRRLLVVACLLALASLALMTWSLFDPRPIPVILAMSMGQAVGTASLAAFVYVVLADLRSGPTKRDARDDAEAGDPSRAP